MTQSATFKGFLSSSNTMVVSRLLQTPINVWYFQKKWQGTIKRWHSLFQTLEKCLIYTFVTLNNNSPAVLIQLCSREWIKDCVTKKRYSKPLFLLSPQVTYPNSYREFGLPVLSRNPTVVDSEWQTEKEKDKTGDPCWGASLWFCTL